MNSLIVVVSMGMCLSWMISLIDYQVYHRLTTQILVQTTQDEYLLEGLFLYAQTYYEKYEKVLQLPITVSLGGPLGQTIDKAVVFYAEEGELVVIKIHVRGIAHERIIRS